MLSRRPETSPSVLASFLPLSTTYFATRRRSSGSEALSGSLLTAMAPQTATSECYTAGVFESMRLEYASCFQLEGSLHLLWRRVGIFWLDQAMADEQGE